MFSFFLVQSQFKAYLGYSQPFVILRILLFVFHTLGVTHHSLETLLAHILHIYGSASDELLSPDLT